MRTMFYFIQLLAKWKTTMTEHVFSIYENECSQIELYRDQAEQYLLQENYLLILNFHANILNTIQFKYKEAIDRWFTSIDWIFDKRWTKSSMIQSISANDDHLLFHTNQSIDFCTENLIRQFSIDLVSKQHIFLHFIFFIYRRIMFGYLLINKGY